MDEYTCIYFFALSAEMAQKKHHLRSNKHTKRLDLGF